MKFTDAEFWVLDLVSEDAYPLGHLGDSDTKPDEIIELTRSFLARGLIELYDDEAASELPLSAAEAERVLEELTSAPFRTDDWWRFEAFATDDGQSAYRVAYEERH